MHLTLDEVRPTRQRGPSKAKRRAFWKSPTLVRKNANRIASVVMRKRRDYKQCFVHDMDEPEPLITESAHDDWEKIVYPELLTETHSLLMYYVTSARTWLRKWVGLF